MLLFTALPSKHSQLRCSLSIYLPMLSQKSVSPPPLSHRQLCLLFSSSSASYSSVSFFSSTSYSFFTSFSLFLYLLLSSLSLIHTLSFRAISAITFLHLPLSAQAATTVELHQNTAAENDGRAVTKSPTGEISIRISIKISTKPNQCRD